MTGIEPWVQVFGTIIVPIVVALGSLMLVLHGANVKRYDANVKRYEHLHECLHRMDGRIIRLETRLASRTQEETSP